MFVRILGFTIFNRTFLNLPSNLNPYSNNFGGYREFSYEILLERENDIFIFRHSRYPVVRRCGYGYVPILDKIEIAFFAMQSKIWFHDHSSSVAH